MINPYDDIRRAHAEARELMRAADAAAGSMADLLRGRLRHVSAYTLKALKKELQDFNAHTGNWRA